MERERRKRSPRFAALLCTGITLMRLGGTSGGDPPPVLEPLEPVPVEQFTRPGTLRTSAFDASCTVSTECDDGQACTSDFCSKGTCMNVPIADCVPCPPAYVCPPVDVVFVMDTSGSMRDEAAALCAGIFQVIADLNQQGVAIQANFLGITEAPGGSFSCLTNHVLGLLGGTVPGDPDVCPFPTGTSPFESWGPATAIVAQRFPWTPGAKRLVVPISDEGPCDGSRPEGCNDPGDDRDSIINAVAVALAANVVISPITGTGSDACVLNLAAAAAAGTGGITRRTNNPKQDLFDAFEEIVFHLCEVDDRCDDQNACTTDDRCRDGKCEGTPIESCRPCTPSDPCDDDDACTMDSCIGGECFSTPNHDDSTQCCDPDDGSLTPRDDGDPCTLDVCDPLTGLVSHPPSPEGTICNDEEICTVLDKCDGTGRCEGTDLDTVRCTSNADCFGQTCDVAIGSCVCGNDVPELCLNAIPGGLPESGCYSVGSDLFVPIDLGSSSRTIVGGQFFVIYDPTVLDFINIEPGANADPDSPFGTELLRTVNESTGSIFYAVGIILGMNGTPGPAIMARIHFRPLKACVTEELCLLNQNPNNTILVDDRGQPVQYTTCCTGELVIHGKAPVLQCPQDIAVNAGPETPSATVAWTPITAGGECDGALVTSCAGIHGSGTDLSHLAGTGGRFPIGITEFECTAVDSCGASTTCEWAVEVHNANTVEVHVQFSPVVTSNLLQRCIEFEFYSTCFDPPVVVEQTLDFGGLFNFPGTASSVILKVPAGQYGCVTARDPKHTLRSVSNLQVVNGKYVARFTGDPRLGGNWLLGGNLNGDRVIDMLDESLLAAQFSASLNPNTPCGAGVGLHSDLNGNGTVDSNDLGFIQRNFLASDKGACCPGAATAAEGATPSTVTLEELNALGLPLLRAADADDDGMLTPEEIMSFLGWGSPVTPNP